MPVIEHVRIDRRNQKSIKLLRHSNNIHSQAGEDGIIAAIFDIIGTRNKWCVEFGAWDGLHMSNTAHLVRDKQWNVVQIEGSQSRFEILKQNFPQLDNGQRIEQICGMVGFEKGVDSLDDFLAKTPIPIDFDLASIDIDGNDYHIWDSLVTYRPRIVVIEYNPVVPNDVIFIQDRDMSVNEGASLEAMIRLGKSKGYELICVTSLNCIFCLKEEFARFEIDDNSADSMKESRNGRIFCGLNGRIYHTMPRLAWNGRYKELRPDSLQLLKPEEIRYGDKVRDPIAVQPKAEESEKVDQTAA